MTDDRERMRALARLPRAVEPSLEDYVLADLTAFALGVAHLSAQPREFFVGDRVRFRNEAGLWREGYVERTLTFANAVRDMGEEMAVGFRDQCRRETGVDFETRWMQVLVTEWEGGARVWVLGQNLEVVEGRSP